MSTNISISRSCQYCGNLFLAKTTVTKYCSHKCNSRHYKERVRAAKISTSDEETTKDLGGIEKKIRKEVLEENQLLSVSEVATLIRSTPKAVYKMIHSERLRARNFGIRKFRILRSDIFAIFEEPPIVLQSPPKLEVDFIESHTPLTREACYSISDLIALFDKTRSDLYTFLSRRKVPKMKIGKEAFYERSAVDKVYRKWKAPKKLGLQEERERNEGLKKKQLQQKDCYSMDECVALFKKDRGLVYGILNRRNVPKLRIGHEIYRSKEAVNKILRSIKREEEM